ncbi:MAG: hypothetical protein NZ827_02410, partial [Aquificaceae bacterium]|nr:hypothetical protein [Aquificaceae bacterium]
GKKKWREANGYGRRWHLESFFSSFKRWFGEYVSSVKFENIRKELTFKVMIVSMFLSGSGGVWVYWRIVKLLLDTAMGNFSSDVFFVL